FIENKVDYSKSRNLILTSVVLIIGLSGITIDIPYAGKVVCSLKGMGLASVVAIVMSLLFIVFEKLNIMNEK
ncbi:MAG: uracil permease, partial [Inconstantimicrobium porci]|nr:uracil permease [Inconstantimicrobium porci]